MIEISVEVLDYPIVVTANQAGQDWSVSIFGGCAPHVGSVSLAEYQDNSVTLRTLLRDTHKDQIVGDLFARTLSELLHCTVCVSCGIHYDNPSEADLSEIVSCTNILLDKLCRKIKQ